jgi:hypothetical protein
MKLSLHIGLNSVNPPAYGGWLGWLNGPTFDCAVLSSPFALAGYTVKSLLNEAATLAGVQREILALAEAAHAGDTVFIQYSGHGGRQDHGLFGGYHETLCLFDGQLLDVELRKLLTHFRAGVRIVVFLDSCHSGGMDRSLDNQFTRARVRPAWIHPRAPMLEKGDAPVMADAIIASACQPEETCIETMVVAFKRVLGAFTHCASESLAADDTFGTWLAKTTSRALSLYPAQHPRIIRLGVAPEQTLEASIA